MKSLYPLVSRVQNVSNVKLSESLATNRTENLLKKFILRTAGVVALMLFLGGSVWGQTQLIDPAGAGGFEGTHGWTIVNPGTNNWRVSTGATAGFSGTNCAYISNSASAPFAQNYTNTTSQVSSIYRDVTFPAGETSITLSFNWICTGETTAFDRMRVWLVPTSNPPSATQYAVSGTAPTGVIQIGATNYNGQSTWTSTQITVPAAYAGNSARLVFQWRNDGSGGSLPIAIDNVNLTSRIACSGTPAPGNTNLSTSTICTGGSTNLSLQNATSGTFLNYVWQSSPNNSTWTNMYQLVNTDFSTLPANTNVYGNASLGTGELILTPNTGSNTGGYVIQNTMGVNSNSFRASFDYRINDGGGADGMSLSFAPTINNDAGGGEAGEGTGIRLILDTYNASTASRITLMYNGSVIWENSWNAFALRNASYRNVTLFVDNNGWLSLSIAGTTIVDALKLPEAYNSADKSAWKFKFSARTGGVSDKHSIDNLLITFNNVASPPAVSATSTTYYRCQVTCGASTGTSNVATLTVQSISAAPTISGPICPGNTTVSGTGVNGSTISVIRSGSSISSGSATWSGTTWTITVSSVNAGESLTATQTESGKCVSAASTAYVVITPASWGNIQFPASGVSVCGSPITIYGQVYLAGTTEAAGQGASLTADLGWSSTNTNPNTWTNWTSATFNAQQGNNDEFQANLGAGLTEGTWYYAFRYSYAGCPIYGGYGGVYGSGGSNGTATVPASHTAVLSSAAGTNAQTVCKGTAITSITYTLGNGANTANVTGLPTGVSASVTGGVLTISGSPSVSGSYTFTATTSGTSNCAYTYTGSITVNETLNWANTQSPASGSICSSGTYTIYGQVYQPGITDAAGQGAGITVQYGYSSSNTDPASASGWTWASATYNPTSSGNNDEYLGTFSGLSAGTYYYAFRYKLTASIACGYQYGGYNGGFWNGTTNVNGVLTINDAPTPIASDNARCGTGTVAISASSSGAVIDWYAASSGGSVLTTGTPNPASSTNSFTTPSIAATTIYYAQARNATTGCLSSTRTAVTATVNPLPAVTFTAQPGATACPNTDLTYTTQSGQSNYAWTFPGTLNTDYTITSGGTTSSNTVTLKYLTTGSKTVSVNYTSGSCSAVSATNSTATTVSAPPTVNAGADFNLCSGQTIAMNASTNATSSSTSASATYSVGNAGTLYSASPTTATISTCPIPLSVTIPVGAVITGINVSYSMTAASNGWRSDQRSYVRCTNVGGIAESAISSGTGTGIGTVPYSRNNLAIANGVSGGGTINFELHAFRTFSGTTCATTDNFVNNNTFTITVNYTLNPSYAWSPATSLSSTNVLNPNCSATTTTTYTLTVTGTNGCSASDQVLATVAAAPATPTASISGSATINVGGTTTLSATGSNITWYSAATGGTVLGTGNTLTTSVQCVPGTVTYYAEDNNGSCPSIRAAVSFTVRPMVASNPANALICSTGGSVTLNTQLTGGSSITWSPSTNLSTASGSSTVASPVVTTVYTMNATVAGCGAVSGTQTVGVIDAVAFTPTSTPTAVCAGNPAVLASNLSSSGFTYATTTYSYSTAPVDATLLINNGAAVAANPYTSTNPSYPLFDDAGWGNISIPFAYNFFGENYNALNIGTNGIVHFGTYSTSIINDFTFSSLPNAAEPLNIIAVAANDNDLTGTGNGTLRYWTEGIAPTRRFVVEWSGASQQASSGARKTTAQVKLFETTGNVEVHVSSSTSTNTKVVGLQNNDNPPIGAQAFSSTTTMSNQAWKFVPGANYTFQWATAGSNISGATSTGYTTPNLSTAGTVTYSVAATNPNTQCTTTQSVDITVNALPAAPNSTGDVTACSTAGSQSLTVTAGAGETADWFAASTGGTVLASGDNVLTYSTATAGTYYAAAQNTTTGCSSATRTGVTLNVNPSPAAPTVTTPVSYCQGATATALTATATGANTLNWYSAAPSYPSFAGATALGSAPTPSTSSAGTTNYYVSQSSSSNSCESELALVAVTVNATPSAPVASNPSAYCLNDIAVALTATATAGNTLYWYTVPTGGTGTAVAPIPSTSVAGTTNYYVADRTNASGCEGSRTTVTVTVNPTITASVSNSASSTSACGGGSITFTATPTNGGTPTYQWYLNSSAVSGETNATYTLATPNDADAIYVEMTPSTQTCLASNAATASNTVTLTSTAATPTVSIQSSASTAFCPGTSVTFSVNASANMGATPTYQWNLNGTPIVGATNATLVTTSLANNDQVTLTMTSSLSGSCLTQSSATSSSITSAVNSATAISTQPATAAACLGGSASFTVSATGTGTLTYQWKKNGTNVTGNATATSSTLTLSGIAAGDAANYTVDVTGTCGTVASTAAALTINSATAISTQPSAASDCAGATVNFSVTASGQGTLTYQWRKDGSALNGETNATLAVTNISAANAGQYSVIVSGGCGNVTSSNALLAINAATVISSQPAASTLCAGNTANFSVTASGTGTLSYQWKKDGSNVGSNSSTLSITNAQAANAGTYTVDVTGTCGTVTSSNALLTVNPLTTITTQPAAILGCQGQSFTFTVVAAGTSPLTYQWKLDGVNISGATAASYNIPNAAAENDGAYLVTVTGGCGTAVNSNTVVLNAYPTSVAGTVGSNQAVCSGNSPANITLSGNTGTIQWQSSSDNSTFANIDGATASTLTSAEMGTLNATTYYRAIVTSGSCSSATTNTVTATVTALPNAGTISGAQAICSNGTTQFVSTGDAGGTWTSSSEAAAMVNSSGLVTAVSAGTATITYTVSGTGGCTASATRTVTVTAAPNAGTISGTQAICSNGTSTFTSNGNAGGSWTSSDEAVATINSVSGVITPLTVGTATMTYTVTGTGSCSDATATRTITVNSLPAASVSAGSTICSGNTASFTLTGTADAQVSYSINGTAGTATLTNGTATVTVANATSNQTLTLSSVTNPTTSCSQSLSSSATVTVNALPTASISASGATTFCVGGNVVLTASAGASYSWSNGATTQAITVSSAGSYSVTVTNGNNCTATSVATSVVVNALPTATITPSGSTTFCLGGSVDLTASEGSSYLWSNNATTASINTTTSGSYSVTVTDANGCSATSTSATVTVNPLPTATASSTSHCGPGAVTLYASASSGATTDWYANATGGSPLAQAIGQYTTPTLTSTTTYYVEGRSITTGCVSSTRSAVTVTINTPTVPSVTIASSDVDNVICSGESVVFTATATNGGATPAYQWKVNGANVGTNSSTYTSTTLANSNVVTVVMTANNSCQSSNTATSNGITTVVNALPAALSVTGSTYCSYSNLAPNTTYGTVTSTGSVSGVDYELYDPNGVVPNSVKPGTGSALTWTGVEAATGLYAIGVNSTTGCVGTSSALVEVVMTTATIPLYVDTDGDGYGTGSAVGYTCVAVAPAGYSLNANDCSTTNSAFNPGAVEICGNNIDENCSGNTDDIPAYFRSLTSGNWGDATTWQFACSPSDTYQNSIYAPPANYTGYVNVLNGHTVTVPNNGTIYQTGTLDIDAGGTLTMTGNDYNNDPTTANVSAVAKLTVTLVIINDGTMNVGHQASLVQTATTAGTVNSGSGNFNVQSKLTGNWSSPTGAPNGRYWYIGSPMNNTVASQFFDTPSMVRLWSYNAANNSWGIVIHSQTSTTSSLKLVPGIGYLYRAGANKTITYTSTAANLNNNITSNLLAPASNAAYIPVLSYTTIGYKYVANPYPSYVDWTLLSRTGLNAGYWIRNATNTAYDAYNATTQLGSSPSGQTTKFIPPMQGFWVYAYTTPNALKIDNTDRVHSTNVLHAPNVNQVVRLKLNNGESSDYTVVYENELAANDFEEADTDKMFDYDFHQLYTLEGEHELVLNGLSNATSKGSVDMGISVANNGQYTIEATDLEMEEDVILEDRFNHTFQDMKVNPIYSFTTSAGTFNERFVLHFTATESVAVGETETVVDEVRVFNTSNQQVKVWVSNTSEYQGATVKVYDAIGNLIERKNMTSNELLLDLDIANGIYVVEVTGAEKTFTKKVFIGK